MLKLFFYISCAVVGFILLRLAMHSARLAECKSPALWVFAGVVAVFFLVCLWIEKRKADKNAPPKPPVRQQAPRLEHGRNTRQERSNRTPFNAHQAKIDKPVWRNIPGHATLLLDTNVLMCPDESIRSWFGYLLHNAKKRHWKIVVLGSVYEEIVNHLKRGNADKARDARLARNRIELMTDELGEFLHMEGLSIQGDRPGEASYADPQLIEYMCTHKRTFLFSFDNDLKIRCKHLIRTMQPKNRVFSEEDFFS